MRCPYRLYTGHSSLIANFKGLSFMFMRFFRFDLTFQCQKQFLQHKSSVAQSNSLHTVSMTTLISPIKSIVCFLWFTSHMYSSHHRVIFFFRGTLSNHTDHAVWCSCRAGERKKWLGGAGGWSTSRLCINGRKIDMMYVVDGAQFEVVGPI